jgi:hypothetical protein
MIIIKIQGGLGNQLFQYATGRALCIRYKTSMKLDLSFFENPDYNIVYRLDKFNLPFSLAEASEYNQLKKLDNIPLIIRVFKLIGLKFYPYYKKSHLIENEIENLIKSHNSGNSDYYLEGWFGNPQYFKNIREIILKEFNADQLLSPENMILQQEILSKNSVAVHVRRKDYLTNTYFKTLPKVYYIKSIKMASEEIKNPTFYFFSDDVLWVKEQFSGIPNVNFVESNSTSDSIWSTNGDIADLMLMRSCKHQIIANSTFSWWGAWLNKNQSKKVYLPATWYNDKRVQNLFERNYMIPPEWIKVQF